MFSFNDNKGRFNLTWEGFTLDHWLHPFAVEGLGTALRNSIEIAAISTVIALVLGTLMALALVRYRFRGRAAVDLFTFLPLASPEVVLGAALLALFLTMNIATGFVTIVIAHVMFNVSYVVVTIKARLEGMDQYIEEAAMDLGANRVDDVPAGHVAADPARHRGRRAAGVRAVDRRLRDHELQRRRDDHVPALHLRRGAPGRAAAGERAGDDAADRRSGSDGREPVLAATASA